MAQSMALMGGSFSICLGSGVKESTWVELVLHAVSGDQVSNVHSLTE